MYQPASLRNCQENCSQNLWTDLMPHSVVSLSLSLSLSLFRCSTLPIDMSHPHSFASLLPRLDVPKAPHSAEFPPHRFTNLMTVWSSARKSTLFIASIDCERRINVLFLFPSTKLSRFRLRTLRAPSVLSPFRCCTCLSPAVSRECQL